MGCFRLSPFSSSLFYKYSTASEQPGFLLFRCKRKQFFFKFSGKSRKLKCATAGNRTTDLLLSGHVLIFSTLAPYGLLSAFAFFKQLIFINIQQLASNQDFSFFGANGNNFFFKFSAKSRQLKCATAGNRTTDLLLSGQAP